MKFPIFICFGIRPTEVKPHEDCGPKWDLVKKPKGEEDGQKVRGYTFHFNEKRTAILPGHMLPKTFEGDDGKTLSQKTLRADWDNFVTSLPAKDALYCGYEFEFQDIQSGYNDGDLETAPIKAKLIMISWAPDSAKPQVKMLVPSSLEALKVVCSGAQVFVQTNSMEDVTYEAICAKLGIKLPA